MTETKYVAMMKAEEVRWRYGNGDEVTAADWRAMREAWEAMMEALDTALEYARHSEGCSRPFGNEYRCRCRWDEEQGKCEAALAKASTT